MRTSTQAREIALDADGVLRIRTEGTEIRVLMLTPDVVRVRAGFDGDFAEHSYSLMTTAWADGTDELFADERRRVTPPPVALEEDEGSCTLVEIGRASCRERVKIGHLIGY